MKLAVLFTALLAVAFVAATPLDDYIALPDPTFSWNIVNSIKGGNLGNYYTCYNMNLTSQTWLTPEDSSNYVWRHWVQICVPDVIKTTKAFIYVNGNDNSDNPPTSVDPLISMVTELTGAISLELMQVPNEPIYFTAEGHKRRTEDQIIAYTWWHFIQDTSQPFWLARMPMVKSVVKTMDAVEQFTATLKNVPAISGFIVAGASKRGWTTWLTPAVDKRVVAIVPIVLDILNLVKNINHHWQAYGNWSFALQDYRDMGLMAHLNEPVFQELADVVDPYSYRDRLTVPKYVICATGDEFFLPDSPQFFYDDLPTYKQLWVVPDAEHSMAGHEVDLVTSIATFAARIVNEEPLPNYSWTSTTTDNSTFVITVTSDTPASRASLWHAWNPKARDFRLITDLDPLVINPILWIEDPVPNTGSGSQYVYQAECHQPPTGYRACLIELTFTYGHHMFTGENFMRVSSYVSITPPTMPYPPCGDHCA